MKKTSSQSTQQTSNKTEQQPTTQPNQDPQGSAQAEQAQQNNNSAKAEPTPKWYEGQNREVVVYYLIAVFFLEIIIGAAAFFYGVAHPTQIVSGGPRMANFPWVGWLISACAAPVGLLLLFHLSGWFFTRSMNLTVEGATAKPAAIPKNIEQFYSVVSNAPVIVVLLALLALGAALFFLDTAMGTLRPYIPWILGSATAFLVICYVTRLYFLAKHRHMEREYEYRMRVFEKTGLIITDKTSLALPLANIQQAQNVLQTQNALQATKQTALPEQTAPKPASEDDIVDATYTETKKKTSPKASSQDARKSA